MEEIELYGIVVHGDDAGWSASALLTPHVSVVGAGPTERAALADIATAIALVQEMASERGEPVPTMRGTFDELEAEARQSGGRAVVLALAAREAATA
jgi:hypothetical protein